MIRFKMGEIKFGPPLSIDGEWIDLRSGIYRTDDVNNAKKFSQTPINPTGLNPP